MKALLCVLFALLAAGCAAPQEQAGVGVIGGADGPTQIIVTGAVDLIWLIVAAVVTVAIVVKLVYRNKQK